MQLAVRPLHFLGDFAMHRRHTVQGEKLAVEFFHQFFDRVRVSADDAFVQRVRDEVVDLFVVLERRTHDLCRTIDDAERPIHRGMRRHAPRFARRLVFAGEVFGEQRRIPDAFEHQVAIGPCAQREESRGLAQAVTDHRRRAHAETLHQIARERPQSDLAEERRLRILLRRCCVLRPPEDLRLKLVPQPPVLRVLRAEDLGPLQSEVAPHVRELVARSRENERDMPARAERVVGEKYAVAHVRRRFAQQRLACLCAARVAEPAVHEIDLIAQFARVTRYERGAEVFGRVFAVRRPPAPRQGLDGRVVVRLCEGAEAAQSDVQRFHAVGLDHEQAFGARAQRLERLAIALRRPALEFLDRQMDHVAVRARRAHCRAARPVFAIAQPVFGRGIAGRRR